MAENNSNNKDKKTEQCPSAKRLAALEKIVKELQREVEILKRVITR